MFKYVLDQFSNIQSDPIFIYKAIKKEQLPKVLYTNTET